MLSAPKAVDSGLPPDVALLLDSQFFDSVFYSEQSGCAFAPTDLAEHYLTTGEQRLLQPSPLFDPNFYLDIYSDVKAAGLSPLLHYIRFGAVEGRYPTRAALRADAKLIEDSGLFDGRMFLRSRGRPGLPGLTSAESYLLSRDPVSIGDDFDNPAYQTWYGEELQQYAVPLLHYLKVGLSENRVKTKIELGHRRHIVGKRFDPTYYLSQFRNGDAPQDPIEHYILYGCRTGLEPEADFSVDYYLRRYPDMQWGGMDPYVHYVSFGMDEGRIGRPEFLHMISTGEAEFDTAKPTILVASHEASRTGAPLVGLNVGAALSATHNVISYLGRTGSLIAEFGSHSCLMITGALDPLHAEYLLLSLKQTHLLSGVLLNSVETSPLARAALYADLPSVALVHEFAEYTLPVGRMSDVIETIDRVIVPANLIRQSLIGELARTRPGTVNNIQVRPQGCLPELPKENGEADMTREQILAFIGAKPGSTPRIVLGAGYVQMRKGVDLFVQTAAEVRKRCGDDVRFIWVGDGYHPTQDLAYSAWVGDMIRRLELETTLFFLPSQASLDLLFDMASVFFLSSRLDPFPNVVLDAFQAGRTVICFKNATGAADLLDIEGGFVGAAVSYCNVAEAADALAAALEPRAVEHGLDNKRIAETTFGFADYVDAVLLELEKARHTRAKILADVERIEASGQFDTAFFAAVRSPMSYGHTRRAIKDYAAQGSKGLMQFSPRPGFNEALGRQLVSAGPALGQPAAHATTHRCFVLGDLATPKPYPGRVALHLHMHYPELATGFLDGLHAAKSTADLFVTTTSEEKSLEIAYDLRKYRGGKVQMIVVPNRGRDIGPFLTAVGSFVRHAGYDVIGHMHGKRSLSTDQTMGDRWRSFLVDCLLGGDAGMSSVLSHFSREPDLGLIFAEDRHVVGWSTNRPVAEDLAERLTPRPILPDWPVFPLGNMFWARPAALEPLWQAGLRTEDFPFEPLPYDGTVLHAIERMLPSICIATGLKWATVYRQGTGW